MGVNYAHMGTPVLIAASLVWGLVHSLLASEAFKILLQRALGESALRWYRLAYNIFAVISFLPILALLVILPDRLIYTIPGVWLAFTLVLQLAAIVVLIVGVLQTDVWSFAGLRQLWEVDEKPSRLTTGGLYRYVRHPLYTAGLLFIWLTPEMTVNRLIVCAALTIYIVVGAFFEEHKLLREFGQAYAEYKSKTPMLIPFFKLG
jgi:protein-S-isoprenylcysteine O-methyltransferase Ste14